MDGHVFDIVVMFPRNIPKNPSFFKIKTKF